MSSSTEGRPLDLLERVSLWTSALCMAGMALLMLAEIVLRGVFILAGAALLEAFDWILYIFGGFLLFTALKMFRHTEMALDPRQNRVLRLVSRVVPLDQLMTETLGAALMICSYSQLAVMAAKESVNRAFESGLADGVMFERRLFHALFGTADQKEGMKAFVEKRKPEFKNR